MNTTYDSGRAANAHPRYAEPLPEARIADDPELEAHAADVDDLEEARVLVPGDQVVHTPAVGSMLRTVAHASAVGAVVCLYGDAGQGKADALQYALSQLPHPTRVRRVHVGVHPTVPELRRVLADTP